LATTDTNLKSYILALDFDGVFWDSVGECWLCLVGAFQQLGWPVDLSLRQQFLSGRWLVRIGGDFWLVYWLAEQRPGINFDSFTKEEFDQLREEHKATMAAFTPKFYAERERLRTQEIQHWLGSQPAYPQFIQQFQDLKDQFKEVVLITTKDGESARQLLKSVNIELPIWSKENGLDKGEHVLELCRTRGVEPDHVLFVDDLLDNLHQTQRVGARGFLADWGYNNSQERDEAAAQGFAVLRIQDLVTQFRTIL
jgi:phosphoglycolate phosphatase-like HAD superfamily hydrolase